MASNVEVKKALRKLLMAFPRHKITGGNEEVAEFYIESLKDIPGWVLVQGIETVISQQKFFPSISEIRQACCSIAGVRFVNGGNFTTIPEDPKDYLLQEYLILSDEFYNSHILDPKTWENLAEKLRRSGRYHLADHVKQKYAIFRDLMETWSQEEIVL